MEGVGRNEAEDGELWGRQAVRLRHPNSASQVKVNEEVVEVKRWMLDRLAWML